METQARKAEFPTPAEGEIKVATLFKGFEPLIINVCLDCRTFNSKRDTQEVSPGMVEIREFSFPIFHLSIIQSFQHLPSASYADHIWYNHDPENFMTTMWCY